MAKDIEGWGQAVTNALLILKDDVNTLSAALEKLTERVKTLEMEDAWTKHKLGLDQSTEIG